MAQLAFARMLLAFGVSLILCLPAFPREAAAPQRLALVVGVSNYKDLKDLDNPVRDARAVRNLLKRLGFDVTFVRNPTHRRLERKIAAFGAAASESAFVVTYFAGHGMAAVQNDTVTNVMVPKDGTVSCEDREARRVVSIDRLMRATAHVANRVFIFDACRDNPFANCNADAKRSTGYGFRSIEATEAEGSADEAPADRSAERYAGETADAPQSRALVAFSTDAGKLASDGPAGAHSPFAREIINATDGDLRLPVREFLDRISDRVNGATKGDQLPWVLSLGGEPQQCLDGSQCALRASLDAEISRRTSSMLATRAEELLSRRYPRKALAVALEGVPAQSDGQDIRVEPALETALRKAVAATPRFTTIDDVSERPLAITSDRTRIAAHDETGRLYVLDLSDRRRVVMRSAEPYVPWDGERWVRFSADGRFVVRSSSSHGVDLFNAATGELLARPIGAESARVEINGDGSAIAGLATDLKSGSERRTMVWTFEPATGHLTTLALPQQAMPEALAFRPDGGELAVASAHWSADKGMHRYTVDLFPVGSPQPRKTFTVLEPPDDSEGPSGVRGLRYLDADRLLTWDHAARLWNLESGSLTRTFTGEGGASLGFGDVQMDAKAERLAIGGTNGVLALRSIADGALIRRFTVGEAIWDIAFNSAGDLVAARDNLDRTFVWDLADRGDTPLRVLRDEGTSIGEATYRKAGVFSFDKADEHVLTWAGGFGALQIRHAEDARIYQAGRNGRTGNFALGGNSAALLVGNDLELLGPGMDTPTCRLPGAGVGFLDGSTSFVDAQGRTAVTLQQGTPGWTETSGRMGKVDIIDLEACRVEASLAKGGYSINFPAISPSGKFVAAFAFAPTQTSSLDAFRLLVWDTRSRKLISEFWGHTSRILGIGFSPDETKLLTTAQEGRTKLWDIAARREILNVAGRAGSLNNRAFSPDGRYFATTYENLSIWNADTGALERAFATLPPAQSAEFSPDGELIALASQPVMVVDAATGTIKFELDAGLFPKTVTFSPDGARLLIVGYDGTIRMLPFPAGIRSVAELACRLGPQPLSETERARLNLGPARATSVCDPPSARRE
ncbi:caspase family protein [Mesorhizobium sp. J428]|uniref:caspase family protein n=1 Tax=Mesorhizobium sp. J428 TaxID=2898440 RepID=UPI002150BF5D|nr:caspase family protein [Mesorhizobium sp. J428]MCR5857556.1 caspase family protein [Mesorhizobium sp. J428]